MKRRRVEISRLAQRDLDQLEQWIAKSGGARTAHRYIDRLVDKFETLEFAGERGTSRFDLIPGLRTIGFEKGATIVFVVTDDLVRIVRVFSAGRDWETEFAEH